jgi:SAM-dependent methyltransferase
MSPATPFDYDQDPERFRLATRVTQHTLTAPSLYQHLAESLASEDPQRILDLGCGEGALRAALPRALQRRVVGLDASATMLRTHPPPVVQADAAGLPMRAGTFDVVVAVNVLDHFADPAVAIGEARRVLGPRGMFVAATPSRDDSPELAQVWRPPSSTFDAENGPALVESLFGPVQVERWDAPLIRLSDRDAVRDYLIARFVRPSDAAAAAAQVTTPITITKRGALIRARAGAQGTG